jgi:hypothetical protein
VSQTAAAAAGDSSTGGIYFREAFEQKSFRKQHPWQTTMRVAGAHLFMLSV